MNRLLVARRIFSLHTHTLSSHDKSYLFLFYRHKILFFISFTSTLVCSTRLRFETTADDRRKCIVAASNLQGATSSSSNVAENQIECASLSARRRRILSMISMVLESLGRIVVSEEKIGEKDRISIMYFLLSSSFTLLSIVDFGFHFVARDSGVFLQIMQFSHHFYVLDVKEEIP